MSTQSPRLAVRALLLHEGRLLLVNAYPRGESEMMCPPGGGVEKGSSLPDNLKREIYEETGLDIHVGLPCMVNEFHDPDSGFHQVDIYFRCTLAGSAEIDPNWQDVDNVVSEWAWVDAATLAQTRHKPDSLMQLAFGGSDQVIYDPLELLER